MDVSEIRRANMEALALRYGLVKGKGNLTALANATETPPAYLSQVRGGKGRGMGTKVARRIERKLSLAHGWMDAFHKTDELTAPPPPEALESPEVRRLIRAFGWLLPDEQTNLLERIEAKASGNMVIAKELASMYLTKGRIFIYGYYEDVV